MIKATALRTKTLEELAVELHTAKQVLFQHRNNPQAAVKINAARKDIARILTVMTQIKRDAARKAFEGKKFTPVDLRVKKTRALRRRLTKNEAGKKLVRTTKREINYPALRFYVKAE